MRFSIKAAKITLLFALMVLVCRWIALPYIFPRKHQYIVEQCATAYQLPPSLVYGVIFTESRFEKDAVSSKNAKGLMQIGEMTGNWAGEVLGILDYSQEMLFIPEINIEIGCWYLKTLHNQFENTQTVLAAYNAGSGNVSKWLCDSHYSDDGKTLKEIPFGETKRYVKKVTITQKIYQWLYDIP